METTQNVSVAKQPNYEPMLYFVTMEDILGDQLEMNHVLYNPALPSDRREHIMKIATDYHFPKFHITPEQLDELNVYGVNDLHEFIKAYKKMVLSE